MTTQTELDLFKAFKGLGLSDRQAVRAIDARVIDGPMGLTTVEKPKKPQGEIISPLRAQIRADYQRRLKLGLPLSESSSDSYPIEITENQNIGMVTKWQK